MAEVVTPESADAQPSVGTTDCELVARLQAGDESAFDELIAAYQQPTARLASRLLGWRDEVDDVVQEVFVNVLENVRRFRGDARLSTWLASITINCCRAHRRRQRMSLCHLLRLWQGDRRRAPRTTTDSESRTDERIRRAVRRLPAQYAEPIFLRYFEERSIGEIGEILNLSSNAVEMRLSRGRRKLKELLERETRRGHP